MRKLVKLVYALISYLPTPLINKVYEVVLTNIPICVLKKIPCSYSTYLECYFPEKGDVVLDCGAHVGNCAILFSRLVGKEGRVIALEPFEDSYKILKKRIKRMNSDNVTAIKKGVWHKNTTLSLQVFLDSSFCKIINNDNNVFAGENKTEINCITIDDLAKELKLMRLDMIKMDIEGAEIEALEGSGDTIKKFFPCFAIASYHIRNKEQTFLKVEQYLNHKGYSTKTFFSPHLTTCGKKLEDK